MTPIEFPGQNMVFTAPDGVPEEQCGALPAFVHEGGIMSCWQLDDADLEEINKTGLIWLNVVSTQMPPVSLIAAEKEEVNDGEL